MSLRIAKRHFNIDEYYRIAGAGVFADDDRVELIAGEILEMSPIGSRHAACVRRLDSVLNRLLAGVAQVSIQSPVRLSDYSLPQPDVALLKPRDDFYADAHPGPADILLIIEVADTSVEYDREVKVPLYARAGIQEVWVIDISSEVIEIYADPVNGKYQDTRIAQRGNVSTSSTIPQLTFDVDAILG